MKFLLFPLGMVFHLSSKFRRFLYRKDILKSYQLSTPVISVGNLTVGGTGKTPFVDVLLSQFEKHGITPCVLTRGYGRQSTESVTVSKLSSTAEVGDEPRWLFERHPRSIIFVSRKRAYGAQFISGAGVFILDDGLQHLKLKRDFEITLIDASRPLDDYYFLPLGRARNPFITLRDTDLVVMTRVNQTSKGSLDLIRKKIENVASCPIIECGVSFLECLNLITQKPLNISGRNAVLISGIGHPESFEKLLRESIPSLKITSHHQLKDHFLYTESGVNKFIDDTKEKGCDLILLTEKDAVKWAEILKQSASLSKELTIGVVVTELTFSPELPDIYDLVFDKSR